MGAALAVVGGVAAAGQARINGELGVRLHDGIAAATISFVVGLLAVAAVAAATPAGRRGVLALRTALRRGELRWWQCLGGLCGATLVVSQGVTAALLGVATFTIAVVAGQAVSGLLVDYWGWGPTGRHPLTTGRVAGAALAVLAVGVATGGHRLDSSLWWALFPAAGGLLIGWQAGVNGLVRQATASTSTATLLNFVTGTVGLLVALTVATLIRGPAAALPAEPVLYLGGLVGVCFIAIAAAVVPFTGVLLFGLASIAGQLIGALLLDLLLPTASGRPGTATLIGAGIALGAVGIAERFRR